LRRRGERRGGDKKERRDQPTHAFIVSPIAGARALP
jgi:hypothetical protein